MFTYLIDEMKSTIQARLETKIFVFNFREDDTKPDFKSEQEDQEKKDVDSSVPNTNNNHDRYIVLKTTKIMTSSLTLFHILILAYLHVCLQRTMECWIFLKKTMFENQFTHLWFILVSFTCV